MYYFFLDFFVFFRRPLSAKRNGSSLTKSEKVAKAKPTNQRKKKYKMNEEKKMFTLKMISLKIINLNQKDITTGQQERKKRAVQQSVSTATSTHSCVYIKSLNPPVCMCAVI